MMRADADILDAIFHPYQQGLFSDSTTEDECIKQERVHVDLETGSSGSQESNQGWKSVQLAAIRLSESGQNAAAITMLSECIASSPDAAALYNDRCQMYRMMDQHELAWADIQKAIHLAHEHNAVSILGQAYMQRAILRKLSRFAEASSQDDIQADYEASARYGNRIAAYYAVKNNPYAAMCNTVLKKAMMMHDECSFNKDDF